MYVLGWQVATGCCHRVLQALGLNLLSNLPATDLFATSYILDSWQNFVSTYLCCCVTMKPTLWLRYLLASGAVTACSFARVQQPGEGPPSLCAAVLSGVFCCSTRNCCESVSTYLLQGSQCNRLPCSGIFVRRHWASDDLLPTLLGSCCRYRTGHRENLFYIVSLLNIIWCKLHDYSLWYLVVTPLNADKWLYR